MDSSIISSFGAVVFDLDGTLLVSNIDFRAVRETLGVPEPESILDFLETRDKEERERGRIYLDSVEKRAALEARIQPGVEKVLAWLEGKGIPYGVLTRNTLATWKIIVSKFSFIRPELCVTRDCAPPKPKVESLDPFRTLWGVHPDEMVHVGDYRYDLELAEAAGMYSILFNEKGKNPFSVGCHRVVSNHAELLECLRSLPFGE